MIQRRGSLGLSTKTFERLLILSDIFRKKFERNEAVEARVLRFVNNPHAAAAQLLDNAVVRDNLANHFPTSDWAEILRFDIGQVNKTRGRGKVHILSALVNTNKSPTHLSTQAKGTQIAVLV